VISEDWAKLQNAIESAREHQTGFQTDYWVKLAGGGQRLLRASGRYDYSDNGNTKNIMMVVQEIQSS